MATADQAPAAKPPAPAEKAPVGLRVIAMAKIIKGAAWAGLSLGLFDLIHQDLTAQVNRFVHEFRISPENHYVVLALDKLGVVTPATLRRLGMLTAVDATIQLIEGFGLWLGAWWAEYLVVISTGLFVPEEYISVYHNPDRIHLAVLVINLVVLGYVFDLVLKRHLERSRAQVAAKAAEPRGAEPPPPPA